MIKDDRNIRYMIKNEYKIIAMYKDGQLIFGGEIEPPIIATPEQVEILVAEAELTKVNGTAYVEIPDEIEIAMSKNAKGQLVVNENYSNVQFRKNDNGELEMITDGDI